MTNYRMLQKFNQLEMANFLYEVSEGYRIFSTCKDECNDCKKSEIECVRHIKDWLNQDNSRKRRNQIFLAKVDDLIDEVEDLAWTHKDHGLPYVREKISKLLKEYMKDKEV